jgi:membrane-associated phospholipid phosphatase
MKSCISTTAVSFCKAVCISALLLSEPCVALAEVSRDGIGRDFLAAATSKSCSVDACVDDETLTAEPARPATKLWQDVALQYQAPVTMTGLTEASQLSLAANPTEPAAAETKPDPLKKDWPWRRASIGELAGITVAAGLTLYSEAAYGEPKHADWTSHNGFDEGFRSALRLGSSSARNTVGTIGDGLMGLLIAEPIVDSFATLGYRDRRWDALWQTSVINLESFTFTALVSSVMQNSIKREKPFQRDCPDGSCVDEQPNRGMPSGHVAFAFTGAGLYCTHHEYQSLYDPETERTLCYTSLGLAAADGVARIMADRHYATDVLAGSAIGLFSGFLLPRLLHYYWADNETDQSRAKSEGEASFLQRVSLSPQLLSGGGSLSCSVRF